MWINKWIFPFKEKKIVGNRTVGYGKWKKKSSGEQSEVNAMLKHTQSDFDIVTRHIEYGTRFKYIFINRAKNAHFGIWNLERKFTKKQFV